MLNKKMVVGDLDSLVQKKKGGKKQNKKSNDLNNQNKNILNKYKKLLKNKYKNYSFFSLSKRKKNVKNLLKESEYVDNKKGLLDLGIETAKYFEKSKKKNQLYQTSLEYQKSLENKIKIENKEKRFPKINDTLKNHKDNVYFLEAHGSIFPFNYFFVPHNLSIILTTTPGYYTYSRVSKGSFISYSVDKYLLENLLPGISYGPKGMRNQLRFFKSGDIINNVNLDFKMDYRGSNKTWQGGIMKYYDSIEIKQSSKKKNGKALLNHHISKDNKGRPSWPFINNKKYKLTLQEIVKTFHGKKGHYVLIVGSCLSIPNRKLIKNKSIVYKNFDLLKKKLNCFQDLSEKIDETKEKNRLQNFSSTYKKENCYYEIMRKIKIVLNNINIYLDKFYESINKKIENLKIEQQKQPKQWQHIQSQRIKQLEENRQREEKWMLFQFKDTKKKLEEYFHKTKLFTLSEITDILKELDDKNNMKKYNINLNYIKIPAFMNPM